MKQYLKKTSLVFLLLFSSLSYAEISDKTINTLLDLSGLTEQISQYPEVFKSGIEQAKQQGTPFPDDGYQLIIQKMEESTLSKDIIERISYSLKQSLSEEEGEELLTWFKSDLGKEITKAEEDAGTAEAFQNITEMAEDLLTKTEKVAFAKRLDALIGATEMNMDIQENTGIAVFSIIMTLLQPDVPLDLAPVKAQMDSVRAETKATVEQMITASMVYTYQNIDDKKLAQYEEFLKKPTSMKFNKSVTENLGKGLEVSFSKWLVEVTLLLEERVKS